MWYSVVYIWLHINTLLCHTLVSVLVLGIRIATFSLEANIIGYLVLGALLGIVLTLYVIHGHQLISDIEEAFTFPSSNPSFIQFWGSRRML